VKRPTVGALAVTGGATVATLALVVAVLTAWARCSDLGPQVQVHPAIRAWDAGARDR
jgi:hypothetical protein